MQDLRMTLEVQTETLSANEIEEAVAKNAEKLERVKKGDTKYSDSIGWMDVSTWAGEKWLNRYEELANHVQREADVLVVIGIGGSNQAARAVVDAIGEKSSVKIVWAGNSISAASVCEAVREVEGKNFYINVIAKNFETLEPGIGFRAMRDCLRRQYGDDYAKRVICTGTKGSHLDDLCQKHGFEFLPFPDEIGGRFTALSPIGLFPMAVAGFDIRTMAKGAEHMRQRLYADDASTNVALHYATIRNLLYKKGYRMEMLSFFEPRLFRFAKWWMQLFGESEGKDGKGLYPLFGNFSEDLHSIGQFLQDGTNVLFETFLEVRNTAFSYVLQKDDVDDRFDYLNGKDFDEINRAACEATVLAHSKRFPCVRLSIDSINEESFGQLFYFFEFACYVSALILEVNPFDQPGVEAYKQNMFKNLGK